MSGWYGVNQTKTVLLKGGKANGKEDSLDVSARTASEAD
ncbi:MAG: hypothetical protein UT32_C0012G0028 [Parcubacteria group bacterium GW2011_GWC2_39_14]|nr:MAG: hypothetical protein UT32_C0012G0028 [Parcubacteria group bacterium GW2011_GWC2_39_14]KKR55199.1 MAG: hypothetical protein UT91_C0004G0098 [Parcubacteria group bacterium GW2011_GWA2_40_23]